MSRKDKLEIDFKWIKRMLLMMVLDAICIMLCCFGAVWMRFDFHFSSIPSRYLYGCIDAVPVVIVTNLIVYYIFRLYHSVWRFAGVNEAFRVASAYIVLIPVYYIEDKISGLDMPRSFYFAGWILGFISCILVRYAYRILRTIVHDYLSGKDKNRDRVLIVGAGQAARLLLKEINTSKEINKKVCCLVDDNPYKWNKNVEGIRIIGGRHKIPEAVEHYGINQIIYAIPAAKPEDQKEILTICKDTGCRIKRVPGIYQLVNGEISIKTLKDVEIADLLGRAEIKVNNEEIYEAIHGKIIMVTGGGGSIGSELCRQIAAAEPEQLIVFDIYENNAYEIQQELNRKYPKLNLVILIGSVRNTKRIKSILEEYHPYAIYHAAAHKHVPLMEDSPNEAIKNNVMGTYKMAEAAAEAGVRKFLLISTDKAVNPTNIMGASKRLCEMVVQMMSRKHPDTDYMAVRFGNVLGSNGSVIPLFKKQIAAGGPVTVTDKNIIRYFMTIPEAVSLVLQACHYAKGGEIFILDMGEPVKIDDMARNLIKLSGYTPDVDIKIEYTGLRPGEKLYEELLMKEEGMQETDNKLIFIGNPIEMDDQKFEQQIQLLDHASDNETEQIKQLVAEVVDTYHPKDE